MKIRLFYEIDSKELYAYTEDKGDSDLFIKYRNMDLFYEKIISITDNNREILEEIFDEKGMCLLVPYKFDTGDGNIITIPITKMEEVTIENIVNKYLCADIYCIASIPPEIFNDKYAKALETLVYAELNRYITDVELTSEFIDKHITADLLGCFTKYYGYTMKGW